MPAEYSPDTQHQHGTYTSAEAIEVYSRVKDVCDEITLDSPGGLEYDFRFNDLIAKLAALGIKPEAESPSVFSFHDENKRGHKVLVAPFPIYHLRNEKESGLRLTFNIPGYGSEGTPRVKISDYFADFHSKVVLGNDTIATAGRENGRQVFWIYRDTGPFIGLNSADGGGVNVELMIGNLYIDDLPEVLKRLEESQRKFAPIHQLMSKLAMFTPVMKDPVRSLSSKIVG